MAAMRELNTAAGSVFVDPDLVGAVEDTGAAVNVYVLGHAFAVTDAYSDVIGILNTDKVNGVGRPIQVKV